MKSFNFDFAVEKLRGLSENEVKLGSRKLLVILCHNALGEKKDLNRDTLRMHGKIQDKLDIYGESEVGSEAILELSDEQFAYLYDTLNQFKFGSFIARLGTKLLDVFDEAKLGKTDGPYSVTQVDPKLAKLATSEKEESASLSKSDEQASTAQTEKPVGLHTPPTA